MMGRNGPQASGGVHNQAHRSFRHVMLSELNNGMHYLSIETLGFMSICRIGNVLS